MMNFRLLGLHNPKEKNSDVYKKYKGYTLIAEFISNTTNFYKNHFNELNNSLVREKRSLLFETPNRVRMCHEYDLFQKEGDEIKVDTPYFIINPTERLAWLKIFCDGERITVARADVIKDIIIKELQPEIDNYCNHELKNKNEITEEIWNSKIGLPCFIIFSQKPKRSLMIEMQFYETVVLEKNQENNCNFIKPIQSHNISYDYIPLSNQTSWIYLQSPKNFEIELSENSISKRSKKLEIRSDPEVISYAFKDKQEHNFNIIINIAKTLKIWYLSIYYAAFILISLLISINVNILWNKCKFPTFDCIGIETLIPKEALITIATLISAGIITTRSFMITEETILKKYSIFISIFLVSIFLFSILMIMLY